MSKGRITFFFGSVGLTILGWAISQLPNVPRELLAFSVFISVLLVCAAIFPWLLGWWSNRHSYSLWKYILDNLQEPKETEPLISNEKRNTLISNLIPHKHSIFETVISIESGQAKYAEALLSALHAAGWNASISPGHALGNEPGITIEAHDDSDAHILSHELLRLGLRVNKRIHSNFRKGHLGMIVGERY